MLNLPTLQKYRKYTLLVLTLLPIILTSCTVILWQNPVSPVAESAGDALLPGVWWAGKNETVYIGKPVDGWMSFAHVNRSVREEKLFGRMYVSSVYGRTFLNVKFHDPEGNIDFEDNYLIAEYRVQGKRLWISSPDPDFISKAVEKNLLSGAISERDSSILLVRGESREIREFIKNTPAKLLFPFDSKAFLVRIR